MLIITNFSINFSIGSMYISNPNKGRVASIIEIFFQKLRVRTYTFISIYTKKKQSKSHSMPKSLTSFPRSPVQNTCYTTAAAAAYKYGNDQPTVKAHVYAKRKKKEANLRYIHIHTYIYTFAFQQEVRHLNPFIRSRPTSTFRKFS